jgi:hypothetical protein
VNLDEATLRQRIQDAVSRPIAAPDLVGNVARRARRNVRRARVATAAGTLAVVAVAAVAVTRLPVRGEDATASGPPVSAACPAEPPENVPHPGPSDKLLSGHPGAATLCLYGFSQSGSTLVDPVDIAGSQWSSMLNALRSAQKQGNTACTAEKIDPRHLLILRYSDHTADLVIDLSGCGTVSNGSAERLLPSLVRDLMREQNPGQPVPTDGPPPAGD